MDKVKKLIVKIAKSNSTVLIRGESGTGKELIARAIHTNSLRSSEIFQAVNCAAINENLLESELFGHEKGSFTGAVGEKKGLFEVADGGTLFLDEIGELDISLQAKILRALQEKQIRRGKFSKITAIRANRGSSQCARGSPRNSAATRKRSRSRGTPLKAFSR